MSNLIIGVSSAAGDFANTFRNGVSHDYIASVIRGGATPIIIPIMDNQEATEQAVGMCDAVILSGGVDINPKMYHEDIKPKCGEIMDLRDTFEVDLMDACLKYSKPVLGICRGIQSINVYFGGTLYQDVYSEIEGCIKHGQSGSRGNGCHYIDIEENSFLGKICGKEAYVNSYHHQAVKDLGKGLRITARSHDGVVEAIEHETLPIYGVQFHPEVMSATDEMMCQIFKEFIQLASKIKEKKQQG